MNNGTFLYKKWLKGILHLKDTLFTHPEEHLYRTIRFAEKSGISFSGKHTIIDAGAYDGSTSLFFHKWFPAAQLVVIEPNPESLSYAKKNLENIPGVQFIPAALSDKNGEAIFNITMNGVSSSLHGVDKNFTGDEKNSSKVSQVEITKKVNVKLIKLDEIISDPVLILKMDLQGNEVQAISGAKETLKKTWLVITEMSIKGVYEGGCQYYETDQALRELGFEAVDWIIPGRREGIRAMEFDAIYVNRNYTPSA